MMKAKIVFPIAVGFGIFMSGFGIGGLVVNHQNKPPVSDPTGKRIKVLFWDTKYRQHATPAVDIDFDDGTTVRLNVGDRMP